MGTDKKTIKSYNEYAEKWANRIKTGDNPAHEYLLFSMYRKLPNLKGKKVLCIGSGAGEECAYLKSLGASRVMGVDISEGLIKYAQKKYKDIEFKVMDMENLNFHKNSFDFIFSNLVFHYINDWTNVFKSAAKVLKKDGTLLFSTHHPVKWGAYFYKSKKVRKHIMGYVKYPGKDKFKIYGDYLNERKIMDTWFEEFEVAYYHRPLNEIMKDILRSEFYMVDFLEPKSEDEAREKDPIFWKIHQKIPNFIIFELKKK